MPPGCRYCARSGRPDGMDGAKYRSWLIGGENDILLVSSNQLWTNCSGLLFIVLAASAAAYGSAEPRSNEFFPSLQQ